MFQYRLSDRNTKMNNMLAPPGSFLCVSYPVCCCDKIPQPRQLVEEELAGACGSGLSMYDRNGGMAAGSWSRKQRV